MSWVTVGVSSRENGSVGALLLKLVKAADACVEVEVLLLLRTGLVLSLIRGFLVPAPARTLVLSESLCLMMAAFIRSFLVRALVFGFLVLLVAGCPGFAFAKPPSSTMAFSFSLILLLLRGVDLLPVSICVCVWVCLCD
jgi:hypothetical protein